MPFNQQLWQQASLLWEEAFEAVGRHRAHLGVSILTSAVGGAEAPKRSVLESSRLITAIVGGLIKAHQGCLAVAWNGKVGQSPAEWLSQAPRSFAPFPDHPYSLWIEIVQFVSGPTIGAYTIGLSPFVGREIEFEVDGLDQRGVLYRVANASSYLIELRPDHYASETRLESYDDGLTHALSRMIATDAYAEADANARRALDRGDIESAKSVLVPWAEEVAQLRHALKLALLMCDAFMFMPAPLRHP